MNKCPFLEEIVVKYCKASSVRKFIPNSNLQSQSICELNPPECSLYQMVAQPSSNGSKECIWMKQKLVSYRLCNKNFDCRNCELDQMIMDRNSRFEEHPQIIEPVEKVKITME